MCGDRNIFLNLNVNFTHSIKLGNNNRMSVAGKRSIKLVFNGVIFVIGDVYHVPYHRNNLLSIGQL